MPLWWKLRNSTVKRVVETRRSYTKRHILNSYLEEVLLNEKARWRLSFSDVIWTNPKTMPLHMWWLRRHHLLHKNGKKTLRIQRIKSRIRLPERCNDTSIHKYVVARNCCSRDICAFSFRRLRGSIQRKDLCFPSNRSTSLCILASPQDTHLAVCIFRAPFWVIKNFASRESRLESEAHCFKMSPPRWKRFHATDRWTVHLLLEYKIYLRVDVIDVDVRRHRRS